MSPASDLLANTLAQSDFHPGLPQQRRLYEAAKAAIHQHQLGAGNKLPSSRDLARDLCIARNTVIAAFEQLAAEGYVTSSLGSGTYVADIQYLTPIGTKASKTVENEHSATCAPLSKRGLQITQFAAGPRFEIQPFVPGDAERREVTGLRLLLGHQPEESIRQRLHPTDPGTGLRPLRDDLFRKARQFGLGGGRTDAREEGPECEQERDGGGYRPRLVRFAT